MRPRGVRRALVVATLVLTLLPLLMLFSAWSYERWLTGAYSTRLLELASTLTRRPDLAAVRSADAEAQIFDGTGTVTWDSHTEERAIHPSLIGGFIERVVELLLPGDPPPERWATIAPIVAGYHLADDRDVPQLGTIITPSGQSLIFVVRAHTLDGGSVVVVKVSRRGLRRLLAVHHDLAKLLLFQVALSLVFALLLGRWLVRPLEALTNAARAYPARPLAEAKLAARNDEIGELARSFATLADALESRRRDTADIGADIAHEFKNPLATIAASAELLTSSRALDDDRRTLIAKQIGSAVQRLRAAIDRMLALLRLEVELQTEPLVAVDYAALVEDVLAEYRADPRCTGWRFAANVDESARSVELMNARWRELLRNLIDNALVQPAERREIIVTARREADRHITLVRDHGPGVSEGNRDKIFRRFFSQRPANTPAGTGLGLSIAVAIAAAHGGSVTLDVIDGAGAQLKITH